MFIFCSTPLLFMTCKHLTKIDDLVRKQEDVMSGVEMFDAKWDRSLNHSTSSSQGSMKNITHNKKQKYQRNNASLASLAQHFLWNVTWIQHVTFWAVLCRSHNSFLRKKMKSRLIEDRISAYSFAMIRSILIWPVRVIQNGNNPALCRSDFRYIFPFVPGSF